MKRLIALLVVAVLVAVSLGAQEDSAGSDTESAADPALVALGAVGISNLYFGYVSLASVADGYASGAYTAATASSLAEESIAFHRTARRALRGLLNGGGVAEAERPILQRMIDAHGLLISEAQGLVTFVSDSGESSDFRRYRDEAWEVISQLLASEDQEVSAPPAGTPGD
ncbi:MAG: hypothetical protein GVY29_03770 [Spirochaetes bacterium]|jgi:hypothetical protein|nr:hypothetical protein [Spirochaetota bacterium]